MSVIPSTLALSVSSHCSTCLPFSVAPPVSLVFALLFFTLSPNFHPSLAATLSSLFPLFVLSPSSLSSSHSLSPSGYTVQVSVNDYLDIYCPHYNISQRGTLERSMAEQYILYMVSYRGYRTCNPGLGFKRWECNRPHAPHAPIKFSEKFQRYSAFSLGYEFNVGQEYYYISTPTPHHGHSCLRLRVYVCLSISICFSMLLTTLAPTSSLSTDEYNPEVPKLEKSVSGSSPSRDRLLLTMATLLVSSLLLS
uniref:Ephrin RBD domain-containing protein n=1 Tax=Periophthalmus magnuspinnatus TaxID=409849 RepID=A0A3B3ZA05_9GOBI